MIGGKEPPVRLIEIPVVRSLGAGRGSWRAVSLGYIYLFIYMRIFERSSQFCGLGLLLDSLFFLKRR
jgi:hypothetical protein